MCSSFVLMLSSLANINGKTTKSNYSFIPISILLFDITFLQLILAQIMRHKDKIT